MDSSLGQLRVLSSHIDERGRLTEIYRLTDDPHGFAQAYITTAAAGVIKAWHLHRHQTDRWYCLSGAAKCGLFDPSTGRSRSVILAADAPQILTIPPGLYHGFTPCHGYRDTAILNITSRPFDPVNPDEIRIGPYALPFHWEIQSR